MKMFSRNVFGRFALPCLAALVVLTVANSAMACPSCQAALASQEGGNRVVQGFFWSILFMMSMPFSILTALSTYFYVLVRRSRRQQAELATVPVVANPTPMQNRDSAR